MTHHTQLDYKLGVADNFLVYKYRTSLILQENDLDRFISKEVQYPEGDEAKKRITADYISLTCHPFKTPKEVFDALMNFIEGNNIN